MSCLFFFSSRRRHTRCALVTGVQTCALPILSDKLAEFTAFRQRMNERILAEDNQVVRRFFALDTQTYKAGALDVKTKEMLGLVASMVQIGRASCRERVCQYV